MNNKNIVTALAVLLYAAFLAACRRALGIPATPSAVADVK